MCCQKEFYPALTVLHIIVQLYQVPTKILGTVLALHAIHIISLFPEALLPFPNVIIPASTNYPFHQECHHLHIYLIRLTQQMNHQQKVNGKKKNSLAVVPMEVFMLPSAGKIWTVAFLPLWWSSMIWCLTVFCFRWIVMMERCVQWKKLILFLLTLNPPSVLNSWSRLYCCIIKLHSSYIYLLRLLA